MDHFSPLIPSRRGFSFWGALLLGIAFLIFCVAIGCGDFTLFGNDDGNNRSPEAVAYADKATPLACEKDTVTLDGTGSSDPDDDPLTYQWEITDSPEGSTAVLQNTTASQTSFQPDEAGSYTIELTVEDDGGLSSTDSVTVTASSDPVADAGEDQLVTIDETVTLNGDGSVNPEQNCTTDGLSFSWSLTDPDENTSELGTDAEVTFTAGMEGTYTATLTVENETGPDSDEVQIEVGESALDALQGGQYLFTVEEVTDGIFAGQLLETYLQGKTLDETVNIPSVDQVPQDRTISLNLDEGASVELNVRISREGADDFYTLSGTASGAVSVSIPPYGSVSCELTEANCSGQLTPETTTTVGVSLTISNPVVTEACSSIVNKEGTVELTLSGVLQ